MISGCQQQTTMITPHTTEQRKFFSKSFKEVSDNPVSGVGVAAKFDLVRLCHVFLLEQQCFMMCVIFASHEMLKNP